MEARPDADIEVEMSDQIVITEKSSQARNVRDAVGNRYGRVMPAQGHLVELKEPADVNPEWKSWSTALLKPEAGRYGLKPARDGRRASLLKEIGGALKTAKRVWIATDCDREGQLIGQEILEFFKYKGEVMRVIFAAEDEETLREAFEDAKPNKHYKELYDAAVARQQADQIYNLSLTRAATVTLAPGAGNPIGIGRVKTPTLAIACRRELEIRSFKPIPYYEVIAQAQTRGGAFTMRHAPKDRILEQSIAANIAAKADGHQGPLQITIENKRQKSPQLHSLPSLQKLCAQKFGWTVVRTLEIAQELYSGEGKHITTYPRTEVRNLPTSAIPFVKTIVGGLQTIEPYASIKVPEPHVIRKGKSGVFSDAGLGEAGQGSHHAIVPNVKKIEELPEIWNRLSSEERTLFDVIARGYLAAVMPDYEYRQTTIRLDVENVEFRASGRQPTSEGWKKAYAKGQEEDSSEEKAPESEQTLPTLDDGDQAKLSEPKIESKETRPPARYNDGGLLDAMKNAWKWVEDPEEREQLKATDGIGTAHTRGEVIEGLKRQGFLVVKGKHIVPTDAGISLHQLLDTAAPPLVDPGTTARFERTLAGVSKGECGAEDAINAVCENARALIGQIVQAGGSVKMAGVAPQTDRPPTAAMKKFAESLAKRKGIKPPKGYTKSGTLCKAFLDEHAGNANATPAAQRAPSEAQERFAQSIADKLGCEIPEAARSDAAALSQWIEKEKGKLPATPAKTARPPSERQLAYAQTIAKRKRIQIDAKASTDASALSRWIDKHAK